jgi:polyhydroxyalkanoate synthesis regulator phasin
MGSRGTAQDHRLAAEMAKKRDKDKKDDSAAGGGRADAVRSAVDQAFQATSAQGAAAAEQGRERAQDIVDQLAQAAGRVRDVLDELRPPTVDDVRALRETLAALERRVASLEEQVAAKPAPAKRAPARRTAAPRKPRPAGGSGTSSSS